MAKSNDKMVANNKKAYHDYFILDKIETGIALHGTEVKSLRMGKCSIKESFIRYNKTESLKACTEYTGQTLCMSFTVLSSLGKINLSFLFQ